MVGARSEVRECMARHSSAPIQQPARRPTERIRCFRGALPKQLRGPSWALEPVEAMHYAVLRAGGPDGGDPRDRAYGRMAVCDADPAVVLAQLEYRVGLRNEVVIDPAGLPVTRLLSRAEIHELIPERPMWLDLNTPGGRRAGTQSRMNPTRRKCSIMSAVLITSRTRTDDPPVQQRLSTAAYNHPLPRSSPRLRNT